MTQEQQHTALCRWLGWTQTDKGWWINPTDTNGGGSEPPPLTLDWLHECEGRLAVNQLSRYLELLVECVNPNNDDLAFDWFICHATKEQRLEALVGTLGLWKD